MKFILPLAALFLSSGCFKKANTATSEIQIIERDIDILNEEDLEDLPET